MRTLFVILAAIVVLGGGWFWYTSVQAPVAPVVTGTDPFGTPPETAVETTPGTNTGGGTKIGVDGSVDISTGKTKEFTVTGSNFKFLPAIMSVKKGDTVKITFVNEGGTHDFRIDGYNIGTKVIQGGARETITFVADTAGTFEYYCSVGSHRQMGMKGTLTVTN